MVEQIPVTLVGDGRVGRALAGALGPRGGLAGPVVRRGGREWDEVPPGRRPVLLCTGAQHLEEAVAECPPEHRPDLVFMQNGALEPWLAARGLEGCTRALLFLSAEEGGAGLRDGGGRSSVTGPWAAATRQALGVAGIGAREVSRRDFGRLAFEKLLWSSVFWCLSAGRGGAPVGDLVQDPGALCELEDLVEELLAVGGPAYGLLKGGGGALGEGSAEQWGGGGAGEKETAAAEAAGLVDGLLAYSHSIPDAVPSVPVALEEFPWRNGFFLQLRRSPRHLRALRRAQPSADVAAALARLDAET